MKSPLGKRLVAHFNIQLTRNQLSRLRKQKVCNFQCYVKWMHLIINLDAWKWLDDAIHWTIEIFITRRPAPAGFIGIKSALIRKRLLRYGERLPVISPNLILTRVAQPIHKPVWKIYLNINEICKYLLTI